MKECNQKSPKANNPDYICNPETGRWVLRKTFLAKKSKKGAAKSPKLSPGEYAEAKPKDRVKKTTSDKRKRVHESGNAHLKEMSKKFENMELKNKNMRDNDVMDSIEKGINEININKKDYNYQKNSAKKKLQTKEVEEDHLDAPIHILNKNDVTVINNDISKLFEKKDTKFEVINDLMKKNLEVYNRFNYKKIYK